MQGYFLGKPLLIGQYAVLVGRSAANDVETARKLASLISLNRLTQHRVPRFDGAIGCTASRAFLI